MRMSGEPRCASVEPSQSWTRLWMIDCGCTTTSISWYGVPKRWCASITSRPLFIRVAESIVILPPIDQVGGRLAAERAAGRRHDQLRDRARALARHQLVDRRVLGVDRQDARPGRLRQVADQLPAHDPRLL